MADSEALDKWMRHRSLDLKSDQQISAVKALKNQAEQQGLNFLSLELSTGRGFVRLALAATNSNAAARRTKVARRAYDSIQRHLSFTKAFPKAELNQFNAELQEFKAELRKLGEDV